MMLLLSFTVIRLSRQKERGGCENEGAIDRQGGAGTPRYRWVGVGMLDFS